MARSAQKTTSTDLGRFGLNHSLDVELYMKSPKGKAISSVIMKEISNLEAIEHRVRTQEQHVQLRRHRLIISLLLSFIEEDAHAKQRNIHAQEDIDRLLQQMHEKEHEDEDEQKKIHDTDELMEAALEIYDAAIKSIEPELQNKLTNIQEADEALALLVQALPTIEARYDGYDALLSEIDFDQAPHFKVQIKDIESQMSSYALITSKLLNEGKETEAYQQQETTYALRMKADMLNRLHNAHIQERHLFNRQAERVHSLGEADFFVPKDKTLTLDKGQYHLHPKEKEWSALTQKERQEAQLTYQNTSKDIMSIKMQLQLQRTQAVSLNQQKQTALIERREGLKQELQVLNQLLTKAQDTRLTLQQTPRSTPRLNQSNTAQQRELKQQMGMAIRPNANPMAMQQLTSPQNTGSTTPAVAPTPFCTTPKLKPSRAR
jgi:hypothetical protein